MALIFSRILSLPHTHIIPDAEAEKDVGVVTRPRDCQLYTRETEDLFPDRDLRCCGFEEWWGAYLSK
jgi:S-adenosylmethionine synthetase